MEQLTEKILAEIRNQGAISFARFMEWALYCPVYGYYEKEKDTPGRRGDYFTSVSVGSLFGELLARQFSEWLGQLDPGAPASRRRGSQGHAGKLAGETPALEGGLQIVEAGAHDGTLARDILRWLRAQRPGFGETIHYCIVEPSERRQQWQGRTLAEFASQVRWAKSLDELAELLATNCPPVRGIIFSNELLDAMPVHRLVWDASRFEWFEWGVTVCNGAFQWVRLTREQSEIAFQPLVAGSGRRSASPFSSVVNRWPARLLKALPDSFVIEVCPEAARWWQRAASILQTGKLLTLDYGLCEQEILMPERVDGTLRAYHRHERGTDVLAHPGEQDLTAHVDFSALRQAGEAAGLRTEELVTQEQFLTRIAARGLAQESSGGVWTPEKTRQFQTLTHPNHLGKTFRVLVQVR